MLRNRPLLAAAAALLLLSACSSSDDDDARPARDAPADAEPADDADTDAEPADDADAGEDGSGGDAEAGGDGSATITIGAETWTFADVRCAFGEEEIGIEGAVMNMAARDGSISLYVAIEPDGSYIELADLETMEDDDGLHYTTMGIGAPEPDIELDGRSVSATVDLYSYDDTGGEIGPLAGTVSATCP